MEFNLLFLWFFWTTTSHKIPIGQKKPYIIRTLEVYFRRDVLRR